MVTIAWAPDGTKLASGGADETVRLWDARTGVQVWTLKEYHRGCNAIVVTLKD